MSDSIKCGFVALVAAVAILSGSQPALAGGYGVSLESEWTSSRIDDAIPSNEGRVDRDFDQHMGGIGFSYDGNVARDEPWNYRVKVGYRIGRREFDKDPTIRVERRTDQEDVDEELIEFKQKNETIHAFTLHQTVGYGFIREKNYRAWAGPSVRLNVDFHNPTTNLDIVNVSIGGGPEIGVNQHITDRLSVSLTASYNFMYLAETFQLTGPDREFDGYQHMGAVAITLFWRSEDDVFDSDD
ncbi:MAG: hypothetical protein QF570_15615 [Myxococcota bacterium]|jgi:hypothetical protein|nr:hypothetical protein [Myxococcota bacterium]